MWPQTPEQQGPKGRWLCCWVIGCLINKRGEGAKDPHKNPHLKNTHHQWLTIKKFIHQEQEQKQKQKQNHKLGLETSSVV